MKKEFLDTLVHSLKFQRNLLATLTLILSSGVVILSAFLFTKSEKIIVVPSVIEKEFWVDGNNVSATYLEQYGYFLGQLILGKSSHSAPTQRNIVLRHTDPVFVGILKSKLLEEEETLKKQNASYVFYPIDVRVDTLKREVVLIGDRQFFVSGKQVSQVKEEYLLNFSSNGSRLLLNGITAKKDKGGKHA